MTPDDLKEYNYPDNTIFFLHIAKTGGLTINQIFANNGVRYPKSYYGKILSLNTKKGKEKLVICHTQFSLHESLKNTKIIFFYRDPIERFISAFYYFKNKLNAPLLREFDTVNDLAELWNLNYVENVRNLNYLDKRGRNIKYTHLYKSLSCYVGTLNTLESLKDSLYFIGDFNNFDQEVKKMCNKIDIRNCNFGHKNSYKSFSKKIPKNKYLSEQTENNLKQYFAEDYKIIKWIKSNVGE